LTIYFSQTCFLHCFKFFSRISELALITKPYRTSQPPHHFIMTTTSVYDNHHSILLHPTPMTKAVHHKHHRCLLHPTITATAVHYSYHSSVLHPSTTSTAVFYSPHSTYYIQVQPLQLLLHTSYNYHSSLNIQLQPPTRTVYYNLKSSFFLLSTTTVTADTTDYVVNVKTAVTY
jgi:hypothetical protein